MTVRSLIYLYFVGIILNLCSPAFGWCDPILCAPGTRHIACGNNGNFSESCMPDSVDIDSSDLKELFVDGHNKLRNLVALGLLPGFEPAARMPTVTWDDELQYLAVLNLHTCILDHDKCHNTYRFQNSGQNLCAISRDRTHDLNVTSLIEEAVGLWFNEYPLIDKSYISQFKATESLQSYGHFAEMVVDKTSRIGCGIMQFTRRDYPTLYVYHIACNYDSLYALDAPVYVAGYPASKCLTYKNPIYPGLCSEKEEVDPNY